MTDVPYPTAAIARVVGRAPEWLRADLLSKDNIARVAAEETLAAMIANAVQAAGQLERVDLAR